MIHPIARARSLPVINVSSIEFAIAGKVVKDAKDVEHISASV
jgi:hypothetical protein